MTIRNSLVSALLASLLASVPAYAQNTGAEQDGDFIGCGMLGAGIGASVVAAGTATGANAWTVGLSAALGYGINREVDQYCNEVSQQTIQAFENAMTILGIQIWWHTYHDPSTPWCFSIKAYDCIPYIKSPDDMLIKYDLFVQQTWEAVRFAAERMLDSRNGNSARITPLELANALHDGFTQAGFLSNPGPLLD